MKEFDFAHARHDEKGKIKNGLVGDQKQEKIKGEDRKGEVAITPSYMHKKGWYVCRLKNADFAKEVARLAKIAANNPNIGYDQNYHKRGLIELGVNTTKKTSTDCSGLVRQCIYEATGKDLGPFRTRNQVKTFKNSKMFKEIIPYKKGMKIYDGDIFVTKTKGHTAIAVNSLFKRAVAKKELYEVGNKYTLISNLNIRKGHSLSSGRRKKEELSAGVRKLCKSNTKFAVLRKGTKITCKDIYKIDNEIWIKINSGWICAKHGDKKYIK